MQRCLSLFAELSDFSDSCPEFWTDGCCKDDLKHVPGKIGDDARSKSGAKGEAHLPGEPEGAEGITYGESQYHSGDSSRLFAGKAFCKETLEQRDEEKTKQVSACRTGKFPKPSAKTGEYRETCRAQDQIKEHGGSPAFPPQYVYRDIDHEVREGEWDRADRQRDGKRTENTEHCGHETDQRQSFCSVP